MNTRKGEHGLTFLELIFVISIFAIMASVVVLRSSDFTGRITINNLVQDVALRIVEAQKAALGGNVGLNFSDPSSKPSYGVSFKSGVSPNTDDTQFTYFNDLIPSGFTAGNKKYDPLVGGCSLTPAAGDECISVTSITTGEYVRDICYISGTARACAGTDPGTLDLVFTRPFPDASIQIGGSTPIFADHAFVEISSRDGTIHKTIAVTNLGQVWVYDGAASDYGGL